MQQTKRKKIENDFLTTCLLNLELSLLSIAAKYGISDRLSNKSEYLYTPEDTAFLLTDGNLDNTDLQKEINALWYLFPSSESEHAITSHGIHIRINKGKAIANLHHEHAQDYIDTAYADLVSHCREFDISTPTSILLVNRHGKKKEVVVA